MPTRTATRTWPDRVRALSSWRGDVAIAVVIGAVQLIGTHFAGRHHQSDRYPWDALGVGLLLVGPAALLVRRRWPRTVMAVVLGSTLAYWLIGYIRGPVFFALIVALATLVLAGHRRAAVVSLVAGFAGFLWLAPLLDRDVSPSIGAQLGLAAWLALIFGAAEWLRGRRERATDAAHLREEEARRRMSDERLRIARELHDVVAHNISLINVQAASTLHLLDDPDSRAAEALATIKQVSKETLVELRSVLGALRQVDEAAPRAPAPSLASIDELFARAAATGIVADVDVHGVARPLPVAADLAAYRIVQEALTNVARHSGTRAASVRIEYGDGDVIVQVDNAGRVNGAVVPGNGITGMTERAVALGGNLQAAPRPGGGFRVRAWIPTGEPQ